MRVIADLQIHSKYSRACSQDLIPGNIGKWADKKGITVIGTGDFTHPGWFSLLKETLKETKPGLFQLKDESAKSYFFLTAEVSSIYKQGDKIRRIHNMVLAPNFSAVEKIRNNLEKLGCNLNSDGRPIIGVHCDELVKIVLDADPSCSVIPAHAWTPHFGLFGSLSGFDSVEEAFGDQSEHIFAIETGLSSDPKMNWQISKLDKYTLVSNSDAHSLRKLGREANVFEIAEDNLSYESLLGAISSKDPSKFLFTIEFFPEEGKYHLDGHADCKFSCYPEESEKFKNLCPKCGKKLLGGVLSRVSRLADRFDSIQPAEAIPYRNVIPLEEIIAESYGTGIGKKVLDTYERMVSKFSEFEILIDLPSEEIAKVGDPEIAESVINVRDGRVRVEGGYDGVFGKIHVLNEKPLLKKIKQVELF